jgi:hypothetical protein
MLMKICNFAYMKRRLVNIISIILSGLFLYNSMGYYFVNQAKRMIHKQNIINTLSGIPDHLLHSISILKSDKLTADYSRIGAEITLKGEKYDIKKAIDHGSYVTLICLKDREEDAIIAKSAQVNRKLQHGNPDSKTASLILENIIKTALLEDDPAILYPISYSILESKTIISILNLSLPVPALPPRHIA